MLDLESLLNITALNEDFLFLAQNVYERKYANKDIELCDQSTYDRSKNKQTKISSFDATERLLRNFGSYITTLKIAYSRDESDSIKRIIALVNRYCENLKELHISTAYFDALDDVRIPFSKVKTVVFFGSYGKLASKTMKFNEMFPNLWNLSVRYARVVDRESIIVALPKLDQFSTSFSNEDGFEEHHIQQMIQLNPQMRSMILHYVSAKFVRFVSENLPNLGMLQLSWVFKEDIREDELIYLRNVTNLSLEYTEDYFPDIVTIAQLQELKLDWGQHGIADRWISFILKHFKLRKLITVNGQMTDGQLLRLVRQLPSLEVASFVITEEVTPDTVLEFLHESNQLQSLQLSFIKDNPSVNLFNLLKTRISDEWNVTISSNSCLIHKRIK